MNCVHRLGADIYDCLLQCAAVQIQPFTLVCAMSSTVCSVQIVRLTGSERNLVALCAFSQVTHRGERVRGRATHGAAKFLAQVLF